MIYKEQIVQNVQSFHLISALYVLCVTGVGGAEGDGDIFRADNQEAFIQFVLKNTDNLGVHCVMADGVRNVVLVYLAGKDSKIWSHNKA